MTDKNNGFVEQEISPQETLNNFLQLKTRILINQAICLGYSELLKDKEKIKWYTDILGQGLLSRMRSMAIGYFLKLLEVRGQVPIHFSVETNDAGNARYWLGTTDDGRCCFTVNQIANQLHSSVHATYRAQRHCEFEAYFDLFGEGKLITDRPLYFELNHGYRGTQPKFILLGIPNDSLGWYASDNILASAPLMLAQNNESLSVANPIKNYDQEDFQKLIFGKGGL